MAVSIGHGDVAFAQTSGMKQTKGRRNAVLTTAGVPASRTG
jgi:hypothetical protein